MYHRVPPPRSLFAAMPPKYIGGMPAWNRLRLAAPAFLVLACSPGNVSTPPGGGKELAWVAPTTNADGSPLHDLAGYKLHFDTTGRHDNASYHYSNVKDIGMATCSPASGGDTQC